MPERIYTSSSDGGLEPLEETLFPTEDELQALLADHPELLDGEQIRPGNARRWILVTREKGIAASRGEAARWSVDHLLIDQDAVPTLAEVKRGSNPEIRRSIVGQLLEYAAHASETWSAADLRGAFERQCEARGREAREEIAALLRTEDEADMDLFWEGVARNLAAKQLRVSPCLSRPTKTHDSIKSTRFLTVAYTGKRRLNCKPLRAPHLPAEPLI